MKLTFQMIFAGILSVCGLNLALANSAVNTPPQTITCSNLQCKIDDKYSPYLKVLDQAGDGTYVFKRADVWGYPTSPLFYIYIDPRTQLERIEVEVILPVNADISNPNWKQPAPGYEVYQCSGLASDCPFTENPRLKRK